MRAPRSIALKLQQPLLIGLRSPRTAPDSVTTSSATTTTTTTTATAAATAAAAAGHSGMRFDGSKPEGGAAEISPGALLSSDVFEPTKDSLHCSMRPVIVLAQCFALLPVSGVLTPDASHLKFTWHSPKIFYCAVSCAGSIAMSAFNVWNLAIHGLDSKRTTSLAFYGTNVIASLLFLRLARQWPPLMLTWEKLEQELSTRHRKVSRTTLAVRFKIITLVVMVLAFFEHTLSILWGYACALKCANLQADDNVLRMYFQSQFPQVFRVTSYSVWKALLVEAINLLSTFSWNFVDLFLILLSIALTNQFRQLNGRLNSVRGKAMPEWWWAEARTDYNHLASFARRLDAHISTIVLLSFATNLYFICIQLLNSLKRMRDVMQKIYFCFSFGFLLGRTTAVSLYAATVHDESLLPAPVLYSVSSSSFSTEVMRFLTQVTTDNVSFTGMKFFSITRSLVLTVAGTIVTYELVLVQFNSVQQNDSSNATDVCESVELDVA